MTTKRSYEDQLSMMSDHLCSMNETLSKQREEIDTLKMSSKVCMGRWGFSAAVCEDMAGCSVKLFVGGHGGVQCSCMGCSVQLCVGTWGCSVQLRCVSRGRLEVNTCESSSSLPFSVQKEKSFL